VSSGSNLLCISVNSYFNLLSVKVHDCVVLGSTARAMNMLHIFYSTPRYLLFSLAVCLRARTYTRTHTLFACAACRTHSFQKWEASLRPWAARSTSWLLCKVMGLRQRGRPFLFLRHWCVLALGSGSPNAVVVLLPVSVCSCSHMLFNSV